MRFNLRNVLRLFLALTILASVLVRPPGTMLVTQGETLTYVLCTGGEPETVRIALGGEAGEERGCEISSKKDCHTKIHR